MKQISSRLIIGLSIISSLLLAIIPLPLVIDAFRPEWVLASLLYWTIALPNRCNVGVAFFVGLILDILLGSTLGVRGLAMALVIYIAASNFTRLRNFSVWQQALIVGIFTAMAKLVIFWAEYLVHDVHLQQGYFFSVVTTMILWPWLFLFLRKARRHWKLQ